MIILDSTAARTLLNSERSLLDFYVNGLPVVIRDLFEINDG